MINPKKEKTIIRNDPIFQCRYPNCEIPVGSKRRYCAEHLPIAQTEHRRRNSLKTDNKNTKITMLRCYLTIQILQQIPKASQQELADLQIISQQQMSRILEFLESKDLVTYESHHRQPRDYILTKEAFRIHYLHELYLFLGLNGLKVLKARGIIERY